MTVYGGNGCYGEYGWRAGRGVTVIYNPSGQEIGYVDPTTVNSVGAYIWNLDPHSPGTGVCKLPCTPVWICEPGQTGWEIDGCGNRRENPACAYREAVLASCIQLPQNIIADQAYQVTITVNQGSLTENYKLVFSGDFVAESAPFTVNAGTGQQQITVGSMVFTTGGPKTVTAALVKI